MNVPTTEEAVRLLINEVLVLQAELVATRVVAFASLSGDPAGYFDAIVPNADAYTLPLVMTEEQRELVRAHLEDYQDRWTAFQRVQYPGGWRGVLYACLRVLRRLRRALAGFPDSHECSR